MTGNYRVLSHMHNKDRDKQDGEYLDFLEELLSQSGIERAKVLDLACGGGTLARGLAKLGHNVWAIDRSPEVIEFAKDNSNAEDNPHFQVGDMRNFQLAEEFTLITCTSGALNNMLNPDELGEVFACVASQLAEDGLFVLDFNTTHFYAKLDGTTSQMESPLGPVSHKQTYDPKARLATISLSYAEGGEVHHQRAYLLKEIQAALATNSLGIIDVFSSLDGRLYNTGDVEQVYVIAALI